MTDLLHGDSLDAFRDVRGLQSIIADLPGGGEFMGLAFDHHRGGKDAWIRYWTERLKVAREATDRGSWGLFWAFGRTAHWTACALDDAGWEYVRPIGHLYGQGWPKARSQLKPAWEIWHLVRWGQTTDLQIDRCRVRRSASDARAPASIRNVRNPARPTWAQPDGNLVAPPPPHEGGSWPPDLLLSHCPACREVGVRKVKGGNDPRGKDGRIFAGQWSRGDRPRVEHDFQGFGGTDGTETVPAWECLAVCSCGLASLSLAGGEPSRCPGCGEERWWACPVAELDGQSGTLTSGGGDKRGGCQFFLGGDRRTEATGHTADSGGASRFFPTFHYDAKASKTERQAGCDSLFWVRDKAAPIGWRRVTRAEHDAAPAKHRAQGNIHATIKPIGAGADDGLMRWLVRLITPPGGRVGDITLGSGSTAVACQIEGHDFIGCDIDPGAVKIAKARLDFWTPARHRLALRDAESLRAAVRREVAAGEDDIGPLFRRQQ